MEYISKILQSFWRWTVKNEYQWYFGVMLIILFTLIIIFTLPPK